VRSADCPNHQDRQLRVQHGARCRELLGRWQMDQLAIDDGGGVIRGS
jgi:hypothetical protein